MAVSVMFFLFLAVGLALFVWWLVVLIEALRTPQAQWTAAGQNQLLYVLLMVLLAVIGTIVYLVVARPELRRAGPSHL